MQTLSFTVVQKLGPVTYVDQAERDYAILVKAIARDSENARHARRMVKSRFKNSAPFRAFVL